MGLYDKYLNILRNRFPYPEDDQNEGIAYWQNLLFFKTIVILIPVGIIAYTVAMIVSIKTRIWSVVAVDTIGVVLFYSTILSRKLSLRIKKDIFLFAFYFIALALLIIMGNYGPGLLYLLAISIFALLILGKRAGMTTFYLNCLVYVFVILVSLFDLDIELFGDYDALTWFAVGINLIFLNLALVYAISQLLDGMSGNIKRQKELETELKLDKKILQKALEKAEESDKLKSAFLANLSHEIRTPMNGIVGFSELLKSNIPEKKRNRYINIIQNSSDLLLTIINDVITLSRLDAEIIPINKTEFKISSLIAQILSTTRTKKNENVRLIRENGIPEKFNTVIGDNVKFSQILINLLSNAFKYTENGYVRFRSDYNRITGQYIFLVEDTGKGIAKKNINKIFDRFFQEYEKNPGVGLGLSISKSLIEILGGKIDVYSSEGNGTTFILTLSMEVKN